MNNDTILVERYINEHELNYLHQVARIHGKCIVPGALEDFAHTISILFKTKTLPNVDLTQVDWKILAKRKLEEINQ